MSLSDFLSHPTSRNHRLYEDSLLTCEAPENTTSEVLLGSAYRKLLLGIHDNSIDLSKSDALTTELDASLDGLDPSFRTLDLGGLLLGSAGGIGSPQRAGQGRRAKRLLMPIVPQVARHACVLGDIRGRWYPGNLLTQVIGAGRSLDDGNKLLASLTTALLVTHEDDYFAQFLDDQLERVRPGEGPLPRKIVTLLPEDRRAHRDSSASSRLMKKILSEGSSPSPTSFLWAFSRSVDARIADLLASGHTSP